MVGAAPNVSYPIRVAVKILFASVVTAEPPKYWTTKFITEVDVIFTITDALQVIVPVFWLGIPNGNCTVEILVKYIPINDGAVVYFNPINIVNIYVPACIVTFPRVTLLTTATSALCDKLEFIIYPNCVFAVGAAPNV